MGGDIGSTVPVPLGVTDMRAALACAHPRPQGQCGGMRVQSKPGREAKFLGISLYRIDLLAARLNDVLRRGTSSSSAVAVYLIGTLGV